MPVGRRSLLGEVSLDALRGGVPPALFILTADEGAPEDEANGDFSGRFQRHSRGGDGDAFRFEHDNLRF